MATAGHKIAPSWRAYLVMCAKIALVTCNYRALSIRLKGGGGQIYELLHVWKELLRINTAIVKDTETPRGAYL